MNVRKYTAATMEAALDKVKSDLGRDAVILHTRCFRRGTVFGMGGRQIVEVTAANDVNVSPRSAAVATRAAAADRAYRNAVSGASGEILALKNDIAGLRSMVEDLLKHSRPSRVALWPDALQRWHEHLVNRGASYECAQDILEPLAARFSSGSESNAMLAKAVIDRIAECIHSSAPAAGGKPGSPSVIALVGPTGVGKTTTIAKLAANIALRERKTVGLVTLDTYRIAAVEQLRTYARIIDVPLEVVLTPGELSEAVARLSDCSLILMDTAGRSQRDALKMNDLKAFFDKYRPTQTHLVVSAASDGATLADTIDRFSVFRPDCVLLTKLDELQAAGRLLDAVRAAGRPISYVTTGQDVPDDIEPARPRDLAVLIAGEDDIDG